MYERAKNPHGPSRALVFCCCQMNTSLTRRSASNWMSGESPSIVYGANIMTVGGLAQALHDKRRSGAPSKIDGRVEASLTMLACSAPPEGYGRWTLQLLADKLVELQVIDAISLESVRTALKKTSVSHLLHMASLAPLHGF